MSPITKLRIRKNPPADVPPKGFIDLVWDNELQSLVIRQSDKSTNSLGGVSSISDVPGLTAALAEKATPASVEAAIDAYSVNNSLTLLVNNDNTVSGYAFTAISVSQFQFSTIRAAQIGNSVTSIGSYAFYLCGSLTTVTIPNSVTTIGDYAFSVCGSLTTVTIPNSVTTIGDYAFSYCTALTTVTIPDSVTSIGSNAFYNCSSLTSVTIGNSVTSIGIFAFYNCSSLTSVTIGNSVTSIGSFAFNYCSSLASVTIPNSVTTIGDYAFANCYGLASITIPDSVTSIGSYAFANCGSLTTANCYVTRTIINQSGVLGGCATPFTLHARASDGTWTAGADTIGGLAVTVVKDL